MLELKHYRLLLAVAEQGTLSGAARSLGYSQPAATQQLQTLERHLRTPVVLRSRSGMRLTEAGEVLVRHGREILALSARATSEVEAVADLRAGRVRLACFPSGAAILLPKALGAVREQHPGLSFTLTEAEPSRALDLLRRGQVDVAVIYHYVAEGRTTDNGLREDEQDTVLVSERVGIALPTEHRLSAAPSVHLGQLRRDRWVAGCPDCRVNLVEACAAQGFTPDIAFETDDYSALQGLTAAGLGVALLPDLMLAAARTEPGLVIRPLRPRITRIVRAVTSRELSRVAAVGRTLDALRDAGASVQVQGIRDRGPTDRARA